MAYLLSGYKIMRVGEDRRTDRF